MVEARACADPPPFSAFLAETRRLDPSRAAIAAAARRSESDCVPPLIAQARLPDALAAQTRRLAGDLVEKVRADRGGLSGVAALMQEFALSSQEGVALMCLAEALLRIPDAPTRDALIRDKIAHGDWAAHLGRSHSLFANAAAWGLIVSGKLVSTSSEAGLTHALARLVARGGESLVRAGVDLVMRLLGEQFVMAPTIEAALRRSRAGEAGGFRYSYDMLGEAAVTQGDAQSYRDAYGAAIRAIGDFARGGALYERPGVSIKLSALHPRYMRAQRRRVLDELGPALVALTLLARDAQIGVNIDAEEADRLDLSLDLFEALCRDDRLAGWNGLGFVVQAYQKRAPYVVDYLIDLARRTRRRLMVRLVKGAYWDSEIKRAQADGLGFPIFTRKIYTDVCFIACAKRLLAARDAVFPQFATHNAQTIATIHALAGSEFCVGDWEFQCLHGMGETLYRHVIGPQGLNRPCRIYAPVGAHDALLPYLVRRLLENGANSSFVHRLADPQVALDALVADPAVEASRIAPPGAPNPHIRRARDLFEPERRGAQGFDFADEGALADLALALSGEAGGQIRAASSAGESADTGLARLIRNPADWRDVIGEAITPDARAFEAAISAAALHASDWAATAPRARAHVLARAADLLEERRARLIGLIVREAGRTIPNAVAELREAVDFLRYYGSEVARAFDNATHRPLGLVACISPWNFPLSIFIGQIAAALAAGNAVLAKPAEETPLVAFEAIRILHEAGVPTEALQFLPGDGETGAALVADPRVRGVLFTGSTQAARLIAQRLALRLHEGRPIPLIAETGGQNAMIVDSSALPEQVVADVLASAFDSAGQRCSSLRLLCLQEEIADRVLGLLLGAMRELVIGRPDRLGADIGPIISAPARDALASHVAAMRARGRRVTSVALPEECAWGSFAPPSLIEIESVSELKGEVFGPILHVARFARHDLDALIHAINATGYALTFGVHSRIDETIAGVFARVSAGNIYVNRNMIGAVVGSQPFGGHGLSGTGPKAGGPLYLRRLLAAAPAWRVERPAGERSAAAIVWRDWLERTRGASALACFDSLCARSPLGLSRELRGPVGERNIWDLRPRGAILCVASHADVLLAAIGAALATGNRAVVDASLLTALGDLPPDLRDAIVFALDRAAVPYDAVLFEGSEDALLALARENAEHAGPIAPIFRFRVAADIALEWLVSERSLSVNSAAAGGNAQLMTMA